MAEKSFGLLYILKTTKKKEDIRPVYLRITVDGKSKEISTKYEWDFNRWDQRTGRAIGTREDARALNNFLDGYTINVHKIRKALMDEDEEITAERIKNSLLNIDGRKMVLEIFKEYNDTMQKLVGIDYSFRTYQRYVTTRNHLKEFIEWKTGEEDITLSAINSDFVKGFVFWFKTEKGNCHNSTVKNIGNFERAIKPCIKKGWIKRNPFEEVDMSMREVTIVPLEKFEIEIIRNKDLATERLKLIRDAFIFSCFTGLAYVDASELTYDQIIAGDNGKLWIKAQRVKTGVNARIQLLPEAIEIMERYKNHKKCRAKRNVLPLPSNQKVNEYLKELAEICGIKKHLTFHIARHTFATTVTLAEGVPLNSVSKMLGHKSIKQTEHYAKLVDTVIGDDMDRLEEKRSRRQNQAETNIEVTCCEEMAFKLIKTQSNSHRI